MSDIDLVNGIKGGDNKTLSYFIKRYRNMIWLEVRKFVYDYHDAEDLTMKTIEDVWRGISSYRDMSFKLSTWVVRIARNNAIDFKRARAIRIASCISVPLDRPDYGMNPEQELIYNDGLNVIDGIIGALKPKTRRMLVMRRDGHSFDEVAQDVRCNSTAARTRTWRYQKEVSERYGKICSYGL